ncbi:hypothetical protein HPB50_025956 [Hyalomma asiaticum]|uniref:Uncharacterized protein n=1 Tax=Hyalomma asiaticum TaxID=266040 RepID=A0ACB7SZN7_HYAAI|nr:hypothetical protein HPB50_025956 [Hyalomma asiaticum]
MNGTYSVRHSDGAPRFSLVSAAVAPGNSARILPSPTPLLARGPRCRNPARCTGKPAGQRQEVVVVTTTPRTH